MKARTTIEKETEKINSLLNEDISLCDKKIVIKHIENDGRPFPYSNDEFIYFTINEQRKSYHVCRLYRCYAYNNKNTVTSYIFAEIARMFTKDNKTTYFSKKRFCFNWSTPWDTFSFGSSINLVSNKPNTSDYSLSGLFCLSQLDIRRHSGKRIRCTYVTPKYLNKIITIPYGETLYNAHEDLIIKMLTCHVKVKKILPSIRIAKKHGFVFTEQNIYTWFDMVEAIIYTNNDNHNPKFVAPTDLQEMHNFFIAKSQRKRVKEIRRRNELALIKKEKEALAAIEREKKENESYINRRRRFFDLTISDEMFDAHVLRDINEFFEEGKNMSHCVFSNRYYNKKDSLILSCRSKKGERVETVEVDLKEFKVVQSYGYKDSFTQHHDAIIRLIKRNMNKIRMCYNNRYTTKMNYLQAV